MAKHRWQKTKDGKINHSSIYASGGFHNGPVCVECGHSFCEHCYPEEWNSECPGRQGFKFRLEFNPLNWLIGISWKRMKTLAISFLCVTFLFDFGGLFMFCKEIDDDI